VPGSGSPNWLTDGYLETREQFGNLIGEDQQALPRRAAQLHPGLEIAGGGRHGEGAAAARWRLGAGGADGFSVAAEGQGGARVATWRCARACRCTAGASA
jgi:hypothetical protein